MECATVVSLCFLAALIKQSSSQATFQSGVVVTILPDDPLGVDGHHVYLLDGDPVDIYTRSVSTTNNFQPWHRFAYTHKESNLVSCGVDYAKSKLFVLEAHSGQLRVVGNYTWQNTFGSISSTTTNVGLSSAFFSKIAVDWVSDNVYIADSVYRWIVLQSGEMRPYSESKHKILIDTDLSRPTAIAVTPIHGYLFWCDVGSVVKIERSTLEGQERTVIVSTGLIHPMAITVDLAESKIYWTDTKTHTIARSDFNGGNRHTVLRRWREEFTDIIVFGAIITVTQYSTGRLKFLNKQNDAVLLDELEVADIKGKIWALCHYSQAAQPGPTTNFCLSKSCSDMCINGLTSATCACRDGYTLNTDSTSCSESSVDYNRAIVVAGTSAICLKDIHSLSSGAHQAAVKCVVNGTINGISHIDLDMASRRIFFATDTRIYSKAIDSLAEEQEVIVTADTITGLALDWRDMNVYWSMGQGTGRIQVLDQTTDSVDTLVGTNLDRPRKLIIIPFDSTMMWISGSSVNVKIEKANMDGSGRETILTYPQVTSPVSIAFDRESRKVYWTEAGSISRGDLDGTNRESLTIEGMLAPQLITTYQNHLIFTEYQTPDTQIKGDDINHLKFPDSVFTVPEVGQITDIKILDSQLQPYQQSPCAETNGGCDHICLPAGGSSTCRCEHGFTLDDNSKTCSSSYVTDNVIFVTDLTHGKLYQVDEDTRITHGFPTGVVGRPVCVVYNYESQQVFWCDNEGLIQRISVDGSGYSVLKVFDGSQPKRLAIDFSTGNLYYTVERTRLFASQGVGVISPTGEHRTLVASDLVPTDIVLDPEDGYMFWATVGDNPAIHRANCDGSSVSTIIGTGSDLVSPTGLAIDQERNLLYIADSSLNTIQPCTYAGQCGVIHTAGGALLADIVLAGSYLYYTAWNRHYITKFNRFSPGEISTLAQDSEFGRFDSLDVYRSNDVYIADSASCSNNNGGCSTFCFPTTDGHVCGCEDGVQLYDNNNMICQNVQTTTTTTTTTTTSTTTTTTPTTTTTTPTTTTTTPTTTTTTPTTTTTTPTTTTTTPTTTTTTPTTTTTTPTTTTTTPTTTTTTPTTTTTTPTTTTTTPTTTTTTPTTTTTTPTTTTTTPTTTTTTPTTTTTTPTTTTTTPTTITTTPTTTTTTPTTNTTTPTTATTTPTTTTTTPTTTTTTPTTTTTTPTTTTTTPTTTTTTPTTTPTTTTTTPTTTTTTPTTTPTTTTTTPTTTTTTPTTTTTDPTTTQTTTISTPTTTPSSSSTNTSPDGETTTVPVSGTDQQQGGDDLPIPIIAGAAAGAVVLILVIVILVVCLIRTRRRQHNDHQSFTNPHFDPVDDDGDVTLRQESGIYDRPKSEDYDFIDDVKRDSSPPPPYSEDDATNSAVYTTYNSPQWQFRPEQPAEHVYLSANQATANPYETLEDHRSDPNSRDVDDMSSPRYVKYGTVSRPASAVDGTRTPTSADMSDYLDPV